MPDYLETIARFAVETRYEDIPPEVRDQGRWILLDTVGGMLAGSTLAETERFARLASGQGGERCATVIGFGERAAPSFAAMVNAASACAYETDEGNRLGGGHPAIHVVPPALAEAQRRHADGRALLATVIVAYEVMSRLASGTSTRWPVHSHGTHGSPGAAAAVARLRGHDAAAMRRVLNLAACMSPATTWRVCFAGGTVRNLYPAESCMLGMLAVDLDACGYTSMDDAPPAMFGELLGAGDYDHERVTRGLGTEWRVCTNYFKLHAACAITHPALDAIQDVLARQPLTPDAIECIDIQAGGISGYLAYTDPRNMLSAKFSIPYSVAAAVVLGRTDIEAFRTPALEHPAIRALAGRVRVHVAPAISGRDPAAPPLRLTVRLRDGTTLTAETRVVRGDAAHPVDRETLRAKFHALAALRLERAAADRVEDALLQLDAVTDVAALHDVLAVGG